DGIYLKNVLQVVENNSEFANGLGLAIGLTFQKLDHEHQKMVMELAGENKEFCHGLAKGLSNQYSLLDQPARLLVLDLADKNSEFARGLGDVLEFPNPKMSKTNETVTKKVDISEIKYESDINLKFTIRPIEGIEVKQPKTPVNIVAMFSAPEIIVEI